MSTAWPPDVPVLPAGMDAVTALNTASQSFASLLNPPVFRAERSTTQSLTEGTHQFITWSTPIEDTANGWGPSQTPAQTGDKWIAPAAGWYHVEGAVSLSGTGAAGLVLIPAVSVNGSSPTGQPSGGPGWEGPEVFIPTGASSQPKVVCHGWYVYANAGDPIQIDLWYSTESAITAVDTTAGIRCRVGIVGFGV
jgi:hypothetical protein